MTIVVMLEMASQDGPAAEDIIAIDTARPGTEGLGGTLRRRISALARMPIRGPGSVNFDRHDWIVFPNSGGAVQRFTLRHEIR